MRILLVRHGYSEGNRDDSRYHHDGDQKLHLTETGWLQAYHAGEFLKTLYESDGIHEWPHIFVSPYARTRETMSGILRGMEGFRPDLPKHREDGRLVEKFFGAASTLDYIEHEDISASLKKALKTLFKKVFQNNPYATRGYFGDSQKDAENNIKSFIDGTLDRDIKEGQNDFLIITHGAIIQSFLISWMHLNIDDRDKIQNPGNCDIIEISGVSKNWGVRKIYNGEKMSSTDERIIAHLKPLSVDDLPKFPEHLLK